MLSGTYEEERPLPKSRKKSSNNYKISEAEVHLNNI
jgi:hypothetical protein